MIYLTENISTDETFNAMMGFSESEVYDIFHYYQYNKMLTGEILVNLHTSFPSEKVADIGNFRSLLYYYGLLTMCGIREDMIKIWIPKHCVREQYFGFLRDYYQKQSSTDLQYLSVMFRRTPPYETCDRRRKTAARFPEGLSGNRLLLYGTTGIGNEQQLS